MEKYKPTIEEFELLQQYLFNRLRNTEKQEFYSDFIIYITRTTYDDTYLYISWRICNYIENICKLKTSRLKHTTLMKVFKGVIK